MENDDKPGLRLVPATREAIEAEDKAEPSKVRVLHPVPPAIAALERKHEAHIENLKLLHEADMRATELARQLEDFERR